MPNPPHPATTPVPLAELRRILSGELRGWRLAADGGCLLWSHEFENDGRAVGFLLAAARVARPYRRRPDLERKARTVTIRITTPEFAMLTNWDVRLARAISRSFREFSH